MIWIPYNNAMHTDTLAKHVVTHTKYTYIHTHTHTHTHIHTQTQTHTHNDDSHRINLRNQVHAWFKNI